ncbi:hypothetical protein NDU88_001001 [Pleurodeles waltl]|uniref:Uncharacterized protein n=1 Tax=Pleurodeles waltl TaxID=8319 RepID=A0AAV7LWC4_PLEWA|nr:hypothetical protein NDU88_001001 [Pleurodeles waltl]
MEGRPLLIHCILGYQKTCAPSWIVAMLGPEPVLCLVGAPAPRVRCLGCGPLAQPYSVNDIGSNTAADLRTLLLEI